MLWKSSYKQGEGREDVGMDREEAEVNQLLDVLQCMKNLIWTQKLHLLVAGDVKGKLLEWMTM